MNLSYICTVLREWLAPEFLTGQAPWRLPSPTLFVATDASNFGWGLPVGGRASGPGLLVRPPVTSSHLCQGVDGVVLPSVCAGSGVRVSLFSDGQPGGCSLRQPLGVIKVASPVVSLIGDISSGSLGVFGAVGYESPGVAQSLGGCPLPVGGGLCLLDDSSSGVPVPGGPVQGTGH